jgi:hypothetical protein
MSNGLHFFVVIKTGPVKGVSWRSKTAPYEGKLHVLYRRQVAGQVFDRSRLSTLKKTLPTEFWLTG